MRSRITARFRAAFSKLPRQIQDRARRPWDKCDEFAAANRSRGVETIGLAGATQTADVLGKLPALGCKFPVGAYSAATGYRR